jgi:hypothetical protein
MLASFGEREPRSKVVDVLKELFTSVTVVLDQLSNVTAGIYIFSLHGDAAFPKD